MPRADAIRMEQDHQRDETGVAEPCRCAFEFRIDGDLRFISHHDTLRLFKRALARAALPVRFSQGFNPQPRIMMPLPRPVGVASDAETLVVGFDRPVDPDDALQRLASRMPRDLTLLSARSLAGREKLQPSQVRYRLQPADEATADLTDRMRRIRQAGTLVVERSTPKRKVPRSVDIRPYLADIRIVDGAVEFTLSVDQTGTARPAEVAGLLGFDAAAVNHMIRRIEVRWTEEWTSRG